MKKLILFCLSGGYLFAQSISLFDAYTQGINYESKLQSFKYQTEAKKEGITQAKSALYPQVGVDISATDRKYIENYNLSKRKERYYTTTLSAKLAVYKPTLYNSIDQAKIKYKFSQYHLTQIQQQLALDITDAYVSLLKAQNSLLVAKSYVETNEIRYKQIQKMYDKRLSNKMDLLESKVTYDSSKVKVSSEIHNIYLEKLKLKNLTGIKNITLPNIDFEKIKIENLAFDYSLDDLKSLNLEIKKSNLSVDLSNKEIDNARYGNYPTVDLTTSYSKYDTANTYTDYTEDSKIMLTFHLPLYQGGYNESRIVESKYLLSAAKEDLKDVFKEQKASFEEAQIKLDNAKQSILLYKDAINSARLYLHSVERGYEKGLKNLIDVEDAKTKLFENKFKLIDATYNYIKSYVTLLNLIGKLDGNKLAHLDQVISLDK
jgi:outer membrane protein